MDDSEVKHLKDLLGIYRRNLNQLEIQSARYGIDVPIYVVNQINESKKQIEETQAKLRQAGVSPDNVATPEYADSSPSVTPAPTASNTTVQNPIFISYSHEDKKWLDRLQVHLKPLARMGTVAPWDDTSIKPGQRWREEIKKALDAAKVAVLLVSADFLASDFIANNELPPLLVAEAAKGTVILPVIVGRCRFLQTPELAQFQAVNPPSQPLSSMTQDQADDVLVRVTEAIEEALKR